MTTFDLLPKKKANYEYGSSSQSVWRAVVLELLLLVAAAATVVVQMIQEENKNFVINNSILCANLKVWQSLEQSLSIKWL